MPRYLTVAELKERRDEAEILRLAQGSEPAIEAALRRAEDEATAYLLNRYGDKLPAAPEDTPGVLKDQVAVLAHFFLVRGPSIAETLRNEAEAARSLLRSVARGGASLDVGASDVAAQAVDRATPTILTNHKSGDCPPLSFKGLERW